MRFTNYHVGPTCAPTRSGIITGHYANSTGVWHTIGGRSLLREDEVTLPTMLAENGYKTGIFGKWHLGDDYPYRPEDRGFQKVLIHGGGGISQTPDYWGNDYFDDYYREDGRWKPFKGYCTDVFFGEAMKYIEENKDKPFFCYIATNAPHFPYNVENKYADLYRGKVDEDRARFYGMITNIDENIGKLRTKIKELNLYENTIFIFTTDNGSSEYTTYDENDVPIIGFNAGLKGEKNSEYDGGHRTPFFLHYPLKNIVEGVNQNELIANVDLMPTLLDFCGINFNKNQFHGKSFMEICLNNDKKLEERFIVTDSQRVIEPIKWRKSAVMKGEWRLVNGTELYNLEEDRIQNYNIAKKYPKKVKEFRDAYENWWDLVSVKFEDPIPLHIRKETILNAHDQKGNNDGGAWNQGFIRQGIEGMGYWEILVEEEGEYEISLYRWPIENNCSLRQGIKGADCEFDRKKVPEAFWFYYENGEALEIISRKIILDNQEIRTEELLDNDCVCLNKNVFVTQGNHIIEGYFRLKDGSERSAYYIKLKKVGICKDSL